MKLYFFFCLALLALSACAVSEKPISQTFPPNNPTYKVEYLFEHDGCKVYRFRDEFNWVYFTNCRGETISYPDSAKVIRNTTNLKTGNR